jgi:hypothetical protein
MATPKQWKLLKQRQREEHRQCVLDGIKGCLKRLARIHHLEIKILASNNKDEEAGRDLVHLLAEYERHRDLQLLRKQQAQLLSDLKQGLPE